MEPKTTRELEAMADGDLYHLTRQWPPKQVREALTGRRLPLPEACRRELVRRGSNQERYALEAAIEQGWQAR